MRSGRWMYLAVIGSVFATSCALGTRGGDDAGVDSSAADGAVGDGAAMDSRVTDSGDPGDSRVADAGTSDTGTSDTGTSDTGTSDTGTSDTGSGTLHPDLELPDPSAPPCETPGRDCPGIAICRLASPTGGRCESCGPCGNLHAFCSATDECDILFTCFQNRCVAQCDLGSPTCGIVGDCLDVGHPTVGVCRP